MKYIKTIEIKYFRSIYDLTFKELGNGMTVFTGNNDIGKSNILRALNLFFNKEVETNTPLSFQRDFSFIRRKEIKERRKARQLIQISIEFITPANYRSLPSTFWVTQIFDRNNTLVDVKFDKNITKNSKVLAVAKRLFNSFRYIYVPAIKDRETFSQVLSMLKSSLPTLDTQEFESFNKSLQRYGSELKEDLKNNINLMPALSLPTTAEELFSSLDFTIQDTFVTTALSQRGDGIRCRFIPAIMNYIALNNRGSRYIWGIEEPENSLEFTKAIELNETLHNKYSKHAQIFVTSHSPAFVATFSNFPNPNKSIYLIIKREEDQGKTSTVFNPKTENLTLSKHLGYIVLQQELANVLNQQIQNNKEQEKKYIELKQQLEHQQNIVFVEGKTDVMYFRAAMELYNIQGFSVEMVGKDTKQGTKNGGSATLKQFENIYSTKPDIFKEKNIVILYDCDANQSPKDYPNFWIRKTTVNEKEIIFKKGSENLLCLPDEFPRNKFYTTIQKTGDYGEQCNIQSLDKTKLANYIINLPIEEKHAILINFKKELEKIQKIFNKKSNWEHASRDLSLIHIKGIINTPK